MEYIAPSIEGGAMHPDVVVVTIVRRNRTIGRIAVP
jgi:hypothetical protein